MIASDYTKLTAVSNAKVTTRLMLRKQRRAFAGHILMNVDDIRHCIIDHLPGSDIWSLMHCSKQFFFNKSTQTYLYHCTQLMRSDWSGPRVKDFNAIISMKFRILHFSVWMQVTVLSCVLISTKNFGVGSIR